MSVYLTGNLPVEVFTTIISYLPDRTIALLRLLNHASRDAIDMSPSLQNRVSRLYGQSRERGESWFAAGHRLWSQERREFQANVEHGIWAVRKSDGSKPCPKEFSSDDLGLFAGWLWHIPTGTIVLSCSLLDQVLVGNQVYILGTLKLFCQDVNTSNVSVISVPDRAYCRLLQAGPRLILPFQDGGAILYSLETNQPSWELPPIEGRPSVCFKADGQYFYRAIVEPNAESRIEIYDLLSGNPIQTLFGNVEQFCIGHGVLIIAYESDLKAYEIEALVTGQSCVPKWTAKIEGEFSEKTRRSVRIGMTGWLEIKYGYLICASIDEQSAQDPVEVFDLETGRRLWDARLPDNSRGDFAVIQGCLIWCGPGGPPDTQQPIEIRCLQTGRELAKRRLGWRDSRIYVHRNRLIAASQAHLRLLEFCPRPRLVPSSDARSAARALTLTLVSVLGLYLAHRVFLRQLPRFNHKSLTIW